MISPKYYQIRPKQTSSNPKAELHTLMKQVQKSRIAVENITTFGSGQGKFKHKIDDLQQQLQSCITNINIQSKRHKVLYELIAVLKGQMFEYQSTKKKQVQEQEKIREKQICKYQYEIDQILQKHNEEIAKIHNLKELANSRRSQRVVYSNLFKKLEKQIKHYQQVYKQQLMIREYTQAKTSKMANAQIKNNSPNKQQTQINQQRKKPIIQQVVKKNNDRRCSNMTENSSANDTSMAWNGFITSNKEQNNKLSVFSNYQQRKFHPTNQDGMQRTQLRGTFLRQQKFQYTKELLKQISQYTNMIEQIKVHTECSNSNQVLDHYSEIENDNKKIMQQIRNYDEKIDQIIQRNQKVYKLINQQQVARRLSVLPTIITPIDQSLQNSTITQMKKQQQFIQLTNQAREIGQICGILKNDQNQKVSFDHQFFRILDHKISLICNQVSINKQQSNKRQDTLISQPIVDSLLQKMDRYQNCERILDQNLFRQEYYKQLSKRKQIKTRKETTR